MGRNSSNHSESPVRRRGSPLRKSSSYRERSPESHRKSSSYRERSPDSHRKSSSYRERSPESNRKSSSYRERSPERHKTSCKGNSPAREKSPSRHRSSKKDHSLEREKHNGHNKSPKRASPHSPISRSPSSRTKRLRRAQADEEVERVKEREHERNHRRDNEKVTNSRGAEQRDEGDDSVAKMQAAEEALEAKQKQKPTFELSGKLAAETNRVRGVTLLFNEPPDARKPDIRWRLYVFKAGEVLNEPLYIHRQSCYLFGRERRVADIPTDHPSCSKQHAVVQFRQVEKEQPDGTVTKQVRPYLMDLGSTNKTYINDNPIEPERYYELFEKDTIKFGNSSREYVLLHENSAQ